MSSTDSDITPPSSPILNVESPSERSKSPPPLSVASNLTRQVQVKPTDDSSDSSASKTEYEQLATSRKRSSTARHEQYSLNCSLPVPSKGAPSSTKKLKQVKREDGSTTSEEEVNIHVDSRQPDVVRTKPLRSFLIDDILSHKPKRSHSSTVCSKTNGHAEQGVHVAHNDHRLQCSPTNYAKIVRPWDVPAARLAAPSAFPTFSPPNPFNGSYYHSPLFLRQHAHSPQTTVRPRSADEDTRSEASSDVAESPGGASNCNTINSPLDALFELANKAFDRPEEKCGENSEAFLNGAQSSQSKKKRKSRTAFTNHQIFELEKRFIYQKYLSPSDRDELALGLGLSNAQVITWFQNRRAKLKRDVEEIKKDMEATKVGYSPVNGHLVSVQDSYAASKKAADLRALIHLSQLKP